MYSPKYFTIKELCKSETADKNAIANVPSEGDEKRLLALIENVLDPLREAFGSPIYVNSGYRCKELNALVGGSDTSDHMFGQAVDIKACKKSKKGIKVTDVEGNRKLFQLCISLGLPFKQLIDEKGFSWIHVSYQADSTKHEVKHIK